jgi:hypothetical protein
MAAVVVRWQRADLQKRYQGEINGLYESLKSQPPGKDS